MMAGSCTPSRSPSRFSRVGPVFREAAATMANSRRIIERRAYLVSIDWDFRKGCAYGANAFSGHCDNGEYIPRIQEPSNHGINQGPDARACWAEPGLDWIDFEQCGHRSRR